MDMTKSVRSKVICPSVVQAVVNTMCGFGVQTQNFREANKVIYPVGCADRAVMWIESHLLLVGALALGLALPQVPSHTHTLAHTRPLNAGFVNRPPQITAG